MAEATTEINLNVWRDGLKTRLYIAGQEIARVIAARAALRALPMAGEVLANPKLLHDMEPETFLLAVFRACSISWAVSTYPTHDMAFSSARSAADSAST